MKEAQTLYSRCRGITEAVLKLCTDAVPKLILLILSDYSRNSAFSTCQCAVYVADVGREGMCSGLGVLLL